jgi:hypothetical protein
MAPVARQEGCGECGQPGGDARHETGLSYTSAPGRWVLLVTILGSAMASIDATVVGIALPAMGRDFGASLAGLLWAVTCSP